MNEKIILYLCVISITNICYIESITLEMKKNLKKVKKSLDFNANMS
jgi:hypothetical protein